MASSGQRREVVLGKVIFVFSAVDNVSLCKQAFAHYTSQSKPVTSLPGSSETGVSVSAFI